MIKEPIIVAIELGTSRISGIAGKKKEGSFQILAYAEEQTTACIKSGLVYNVEKTTQSIRNVLDKLNQTLKQEVTRVYVGIGGQSVRSIRKKVPRNMLTQTSITAAHIEELRKESMDIIIPDCELLENIPQGFIVDSNPTNDPQGIFGTNIEGEYLNIIARNQLKGNIQTCFNNVGVDIVGTRLSALELAKNVLTEQDKRAGCALVDLGAGTTTVVVYKQNIVRYLVTIPIGFKNIVDDIMKILQIEEKEATEVMMKYGNAYIDSEDDTTELTTKNYTTSNGTTHRVLTIHEIIDARLTEIVANAIQQVINSNYADDLLAGCVITGGGANMKNIDKAFVHNPRKLKFQTLRVAKSIVQPVIKSTQAASLNLENAMSGSLVSLLLSGTENCVGDELYDGNDIFKSGQRQNTIDQKTAAQEEEKARLEEMTTRLESYKERMREHINRLRRQQDILESDPKNKAERKNAMEYMEMAQNVCNEDYENLLQSLEVRLKNDQRIVGAKDLAKQLNQQINQLDQVVEKIKENSSLLNKFKNVLKNIIEGEDGE